MIVNSAVSVLKNTKISKRIAILSIFSLLGLGLIIVIETAARVPPHPVGIRQWRVDARHT